MKNPIIVKGYIVQRYVVAISLIAGKILGKYPSMAVARHDVQTRFVKYRYEADVIHPQTREVLYTCCADKLSLAMIYVDLKLRELNLQGAHS